ncbi:MAG: glycosyltransferase family 2 protein [Bacilli bacterium]
MSYKYKFSVIIPIYNLEKYLEEAIKSILKQSIGFKENIQLILVNDGSVDNSEKICLKYQNKYPNNIIYIKQKNAGVSEARNKGLKFVEGKYINFFDGDDIWKKEEFAKVWNFFEENYEKIDVVSCRQKFFEGSSNYVALDYKFKDGNQVVDINVHSDYIHASVASSFFKAEEAKKHKFDKRLKLAEDAKFLNQIILKKEKYGLLSDVTHFIRRRNDKTSATQNLYHDKSRYINTPQYYYEYFYDFSLKEYGKVTKYIQFLIMNAIKYRVTGEIPDILSEKEKETYIKKIKNIIKQTDDDVLFKLRNAKYITKLLLLKLKYQNEFDDLISFENGKIKFKGTQFLTIKTKPVIFLNNLSIDNKTCRISGEIKVPFFENNISLVMKKKKDKYKAELEENSNTIKNEFLGDYLFKTYNFNINFDLNTDIDKIKFYIDSNVRKSSLLIDINEKMFRKNNEYVKIDKKIMVKEKNDLLIIKNYKILRLFKILVKKYVK